MKPQFISQKAKSHVLYAFSFLATPKRLDRTDKFPLKLTSKTRFRGPCPGVWKRPRSFLSHYGTGSPDIDSDGYRYTCPPAPSVFLFREPSFILFRQSLFSTPRAAIRNTVLAIGVSVQLFFHVDVRHCGHSTRIYLASDYLT